MLPLGKLFVETPEDLYDTKCSGSDGIGEISTRRGDTINISTNEDVRNIVMDPRRYWRNLRANDRHSPPANGVP